MKVNLLHIWAKDYLKYNGHDVEPVDIFLSSSARNKQIPFSESNISRNIKNIALLL